MVQVVVITDASSTIGRQTALEFASQGAQLVLAAPKTDVLDTLPSEVERIGGFAAVVEADVTDYHQMTQLAAQAVDRFGQIDSWVNNAHAPSYGFVEQVSIDQIRAIIESNLVAQIHGMKAALPYLRERGGTIINVSSTLGKRAVPQHAAYSAAQHGVLAFSEALRVELRCDHVPVAIVDVVASAINTPLFEHAESGIDELPGPIPPVYEPRVVAEAIVAAAAQPVRQVFAGGAGRLLDVAQRISPTMVDWYLLKPARAAGKTRSSKSVSLYTRLFGVHPARGRVAWAAALVGALAVLRWAGK